ncbi:DUF3560 domain-containing protein [Paraburkholderia aspalathi]|uniref:DUF3560 domain-containing protein n=1 Tax=Paraburkholderia aspalathi TaxID=1324617 RepID=UPI001B2B5563|nr:DUF3560 domain-containing protein [Paraburkholderia aspalathi]CAE6843320.1 hypothetical protein R20943_07221 [Paraburkholderia aspalathi]
MQTLSATYSPEDNKLRLYSTSRLDSELYARVKEAGFIFAPKQDLFVAPMWTPAREDLLLELCGEVGDEDMSLVDRAEDRADRFEDYSEKRATEAVTAREGVAAITGHIPLGQPILVGHHSERRARRDAERIESGMRRAVNLWETSEYWTRRASGALRHAQYKQQPGVRHRRMKTLEADLRKHQRESNEASENLTKWQAEGLTMERAKRIAAFDHVSIYEEGKTWGTSICSLLTDDKMTVEQASKHCISVHTKNIAWRQRWILHLQNRLAYERAMLDETGGLVSDRYDIKPGGRVLVDDEWLVVIRVNRASGRINSVTTSAPAVVHWRNEWKYGIEAVKDYRGPEAKDTEALKAKKKQPPLVNYPGEGFLEMTAAEWKNRPDDYKSIRKIGSNDKHGVHRVRRALVTGAGYRLAQVFVTDAKRVDLPAPESGTPAPATFERQREPVSVEPHAAQHAAPVQTPDQKPVFDGLRDLLRSGVQVVSAPQLFPTPAVTAARMVERAAVEPGQSVGEFSAGTGRILDAIFEAIDRSTISVTAVEINQTLSRTLATSYSDIKVVCADFLTCGAELGMFDRIIINPPFANGQDIAHISHALDFLKPGGRLVAICANGPRQKEKLLPLVEARSGTWEELPEGTFVVSGTNVRTLLLTIDN